jgi:hypothetical protein
MNIHMYMYMYMCTEGKISGTKCTVTTAALFHTEMKLAKAETHNHLWNTSPRATLPYKVVDEEWCRPTRRNHNKWNSTAFTTQLGRQHKSTTLAITLVSIKTKHVPPLLGGATHTAT